MRFRDHTFLVTGGAGGIGSATVKAAAEEGASVVIGDLSLNAAEDLALSLRSDGMKAIAVGLDVTDPTSASGFIDAAFDAFGSVDTLVNSAGIREITPFLELGYEEWQRVLAINLTGTFLVAQAFARKAKGQPDGASIVNISSGAGILAVPDRAAYCSSKHGVIGLTKEMAIELGPHNIRANVVAPGSVRTPLTEHYYDNPDVVNRLRATHPIGRIGKPEEIAAAIMFLASREASFVTGAILSVDGGFVTGKGW